MQNMTTFNVIWGVTCSRIMFRDNLVSSSSSSEEEEEEEEEEVIWAQNGDEFPRCIATEPIHSLLAPILPLCKALNRNLFNFCEARYSV
jgi:hypothetical protein